MNNYRDSKNMGFTKTYGILFSMLMTVAITMPNAFGRATREVVIRPGGGGTVYFSKSNETTSWKLILKSTEYSGKITTAPTSAGWDVPNMVISCGSSVHMIYQNIGPLKPSEEAFPAWVGGQITGVCQGSGGSGGPLGTFSYDLSADGYLEIVSDKYVMCTGDITQIDTLYTYTTDGKEVRRDTANWSSAPSSGVTLNPTQGISTDFSSTVPGVYTVTGDSVSDPGKSDDVEITVIVVQSIDIISGATAINDGSATPADTDICAAIKGAGDILLQADIDPNIPEANLPSGIITWTGGSPVAGHPLQRKVSKSAWSKTEVKVLCGGTPAYTMITYVIGAEPTGTRRNDTSFADNSQALSTGIHGPTGVNGNYESNIEIEFSIRPSNLLVDGVGGLFDKTDIQWDVSRDKKVRYWKRVSGTWSLFDDRGSSWASDDSHDAEKDNNPWDGNGNIYGNDGPGWVGQGDWLVSKLNMREWVRVGLGGTTGRNGSICSDYQYWRAFRSIRQSPPAWVNDNAYDNELEDSTAFWGSVPTVP